MKTVVPNAVPAATPAEIRQALDKSLLALLMATLRSERLSAARDAEVATLLKSHSPAIAKASEEIASLEAQIQTTYTANRAALEIDGAKGVQLQHGFLGFRLPSNPGLEPLNDKWTWPKIAAQLKKLWGAKYFHKPKPTGPDKVKIKKDLDAEQLSRAGMKLDDSENFYLELNRLAEADEVKAAA